MFKLRIVTTMIPPYYVRRLTHEERAHELRNEVFVEQLRTQVGLTRLI